MMFLNGVIKAIRNGGELWLWLYEIKYSELRKLMGLYYMYYKN